MKHIAILGATGSIGRQTLEVIDAHPGLFTVEVLTACHQAGALVSLAKKYKPNAVVIADKALYSLVKEGLSAEPVKVYAGSEALEQIVTMESIDLVVSSLVGFAGLRPTLKAIRAGKPIALANKETLVTAGELVSREAAMKRVPLLPVDSEHSAIFQCLQGEFHNEIEKLILTASGGPFRGKTAEELKSVSCQEALNHPNWKMGSKVTIDSATLMNKGLEVIEARWLFQVAPDKIDIIVHPQSIIHSMVRFTDGSIKAQMGLPDMKLPIQYALSYPVRIPSDFPRFDFTRHPNLTFELPDLKTFRCLDLALKALSEGGTKPCVLNAANEVSVAAFLSGQIGFHQIPDLIENTLDSINIKTASSLEDYEQTHLETLSYTKNLLKKY